MIIKRRSKPLKLQKLDALMPRLPQHFPRLEEIRKEAAIINKGYIGEQKVDYHLEHLSHQAEILQDIRLRLNGKNFQIDTIVITDHAIYCVECKHFNGTITFNTILNQFTQDNGEVEKGFRYPVTQASNHRLQLMNWLHEHNHYHIPVHYLIAISDPSTIIQVIGDQKSIAKVVAHGEYIPEKIRKIDKKHQAQHPKKLQKKKIGIDILRKHHEQDFDILLAYNIKVTDIRVGVKCPRCHVYGMRRGYGIWFCNSCGNRSKHAHKKALHDYLLLIKPWIKNSDVIKFLQLESKATATRLLKTSGLTYDKSKRVWRK